MRTRFWALTAVSIVLFAWACDDPERSGSPSGSWNRQAGIAKAPELIIGVDENAPGHVLHQVTGLFRTEDGRIVVANGGSSQIRVFDATGSLLHEMGGHGGGPEEFLALQGVFPFRGDSLVAWDPLSRTLSVWSLDGRFGRTMPFRLEATPQLEALLPGGQYVISEEVRARASRFSPWKVYVDSLDVSVVDPAAETVQPIGRFRHRIMVAADARDFGGRRPAVPMPDAPVSSLAVHGDSILLGFPDSSQIVVLHSKGQVVDTIALPIRRHSRPSSASEARIREALDQVAEARQPTVRRYLEQFPQPDFYPAFDMMLADNRGRIWIRDFVKPGAAVARWTVIEEGAAVDEQRMPPDFEPAQIDRESILGLWKGADDVELVAVFNFDA